MRANQLLERKRIACAGVARKQAVKQSVARSAGHFHPTFNRPRESGAVLLESYEAPKATSITGMSVEDNAMLISVRPVTAARFRPAR